jgi:hypothetical protein
MPAEILRLQEHAAVADSVPRQDAIRGRVTPLLGLYRLSRYRPPRDFDTHPSAPTPPTTSSGPASSSDPVAVTDTQVDDDVVAPSPGRVDLPHVAWISRRDGTRAVGDLEDQAARYHPARHELTINADFRAITDMKTYWRDRYHTIPGARAVIDAQVTEWWSRSSPKSCSPPAAQLGPPNSSTPSSRPPLSPQHCCPDTYCTASSRNGSGKSSARHALPRALDDSDHRGRSAGRRCHSPPLSSPRQSLRPAGCAGPVAHAGGLAPGRR